MPILPWTPAPWQPYSTPHSPDVQLAVPIWTTTPWTLPASLAISVGPTLDYVLVEGPTHSGQRRWLILAEALAAKALARYGIAELLIHGSAKGAAMEQHILAHPFYPDRTIPYCLATTFPPKTAPVPSTPPLATAKKTTKSFNNTDYSITTALPNSTPSTPAASTSRQPHHSVN